MSLSPRVLCGHAAVLGCLEISLFEDFTRKETVSLTYEVLNSLASKYLEEVFTKCTEVGFA